jgi:hypothetical protein
VYDSVEVRLNSDGTFCLVPGNTVAAIQKFVQLKDYGSLGLPGISNPDPNPAAASGYTPAKTVKVTFQITIPDTGFAYVNQHLDDGLKGPQVDKNGDGSPDALRYAAGGGDQALWPTGSGPHEGQVLIPELFTHTFSVSSGPVGGPFTLLGSDAVQNDNAFKKNPGVSGRLTIGPTDSGTAIAGQLVELKDGGTVVGSAVTDVDGMFLIAYKHTGKETIYQVVIPTQPAGTSSPAAPVSQDVSLKANGIASANFVFAP